MGLFDFLKPKEKDPLDDPAYTPSARQTIILMDLEYLKKETANLIAVGRKDDANKRIVEHLSKCLRESHRIPDLPDNMGLYVNAILNFGLQDRYWLELGEKSIIAIIECWDKNKELDLTLIMIDLGRIFHQMRDQAERELVAYELAAKIQAPKNCKYPARPRDKARAHHFAYMCARRLGRNEQMLHHDEAKRKLVTDLNWDNHELVMQWMITE
jgi:hypothetical protein